MAKNINRKTITIGTISVADLERMFAKGKFATVNFIKKSTGKPRTLNGKLKVFKALKGGDAAYDAKANGQLRVVDVNVYKDAKGNKVPRHSAYRAVTAQNVQWVTSEGKQYIVTADGKPLTHFVRSITFSKGTLELDLQGRKYGFLKVPTSIHKGLIEATNKGEYFNQNIKGKYEFVKL
jgi:hypothetical protein